ncbi:MAG: ABC transporter ATP-binding protein/permease, partial [Clostridia bacterium]|nr:ABC transporter ATP-binding protein/permease [Clostridia bacterium]
IPMFFSVQKSGDDMVRCMQENATGIRVIKALSKTEYENEKFSSVTSKLAKDEYKANAVMSLSNPLATLILSMGLVAVIAVGSIRENEAGTVLAFLSYFTIILNALIGISKIFVVISRGTASASRIETVLAADCTETVEEHPEDDKKYKIRFKDVSFSYNGAENNLSGVDFALEKGKTLGIIGATGSGKSTVINLLMRFYDVGSGQVFVDGKDVRSYTASELRAKFGTAFQNDFLSSSTIRENIDYGRGLDESDILRAVKSAQAEEFVNSHEEGLDYVLAQKGLNLSGGQKQRLLIARALAGNPEILILDDSSSALDYATDAELRKALTEDYGGITKIIVAQRISSIKSADLIIVLDDGEVIGKGTHEQLLKTCGEYSLIYAEQMGADV